MIVVLYLMPCVVEMNADGSSVVHNNVCMPMQHTHIDVSVNQTSILRVFTGDGDFVTVYLPGKLQVNV